MPTCPSSHRRIVGPSRRRKKRLSAASDRPNASDAIPPTVWITPCASVPLSFGTDECSELLTVVAPDVLIPRSFSQAVMRSTPAPACSAIAPRCDWIPLTTRSTMTTARITEPRRTTAAAPVRFRCGCSFATIGAATTATINAAVTGSTIGGVTPSSQVRPTSTSKAPTRSQDVRPRWRSQRGAAKAVSSRSSSAGPSVSRTSSGGAVCVPVITDRASRPRSRGASSTQDEAASPRRGDPARMADTRLLALAFDDAAAAEQALAALSDLADDGGVTVQDAAVGLRGEDGAVAVRQKHGLASGEGLVAGGALGLIVGLAVGVPVAAAAVGVVGGLAASVLDTGISDSAMRRVGATLAAGRAALFVLVSGADWRRVHDAVAAHGGEIIVSDVAADVADALGPDL